MAKRDVEFEIGMIYDTRNNATEFVIPKVVATGQTRCRLGFPVPPEKLRLGYGGDETGYLAGGEADAQALAAWLGETGFELGPAGRVLDFGCAAGRVTRWLGTLWSSAEVWGVDIDAERIIWAKLNLGTLGRFVMNTKVPSLPFEDRYFRFVSAYSVFTHIDDLADMWLLELRRVLDVGGRAIVTIMDNSTIALMEEKYSHYELPKRLKKYRSYYAGRDFSMFSITRDSVPDVWYDTEYFYRSAGRAFNVLGTKPGFHGWQTGILLEKA